MGLCHGTLEILWGETHVSMHYPVARLRQDQRLNQARESVTALARIPESEAQIFLAVATDEM